MQWIGQIDLGKGAQRTIGVEFLEKPRKDAAKGATLSLTEPVGQDDHIREQFFMNLDQKTECHEIVFRVNLNPSCTEIYEDWTKQGRDDLSVCGI